MIQKFINICIRYEVLLDVALLKYRYNIQANKYKVKPIFTLSNDDYIILDDLFKYLLEETYNLVVADQYVTKKQLKVKEISYPY